MKKIVLIEHMGVSNSKNQPIGHEIKVLKEYYELLEKDFETKVAIPLNVQELFDTDQIETVLDKFIILSDRKNIFQKINDTWKKYKNIRKALNKGDADIYWFYCTDFIVFLYLFIFRKNNKKIVCSLFRQYMGKDSLMGRIKNWIQQKALQSIASVIVTNPNFSYHNVDTLYIPDYIYESDKYTEFLALEKEKKVVCLGTMNRFKLLEETIQIFNRLKYPLEIIGKFYDEEWLEALKKMCGDNVAIRDTYLSDESYLEKLSRAQYCIIPYDRNLYKNRTSGVLLECVFLRTIPITFNSILEENSICGMGIQKLDEITDELLEMYDKGNFVNWCEDKIENQYKREKVQQVLVNHFKCIAID